MTAFRLYTDGSCAAPGAVGGWAWILVREHAVASDSGTIPGSSTHQAAELTAAIEGLTYLVASGVREEVELCSDSRYLVGGMSSKGRTGWAHAAEEREWRITRGKPLANRDLWERLLELAGCLDVTWRHVRGHPPKKDTSDDARYNREVDALAGEARRGFVVPAPQSKGLGAIPATPLLGYFSNPLFQGRKREWLPKRLEEACSLIKDPSALVAQFDESVRLFEARYKNYQPFHPKRHSFQRHHGESLSGGVDVAARLRSRDDLYWRKRVWAVSDDNELDFVYLDREIELGRTSSKRTPDPATPLGETLIVDLFLANAYDRMPILGEVKVRTDQCPFYALIQSLCSAAYAATPSQRERLVLFGSRDDFVLSEAPLGKRETIDLYIFLVRSSSAEIYCKLEKASIELSAKLVASERFGERVGRIAWIRGDDDGAGGLTLHKLGSFTSRSRRPRARDKPNGPGVH